MGESRSVRVTLQNASVLVAIVPALVWWLERIIALRSSGWFAGETTFPIGGDFLTFHVAARLVVDGAGSSVYHPDAFHSVLGSGGLTYAQFVGPPPLALLLSPLGWLSFEAAWIVWTLVALVGLGASLWILGLQRWFLIGVAALLFPPVYYAITFGQLSALWLLIIAGVYRLVRSGRLVAAGMVGGLLILKPTMAIGIAIWWLVDWGRYRVAAAAAVATSAVLLALPLAVYPGLWTGYSESLREFIGLRGVVETQWAQFSIWGFWELLLPHAPGLATGLGLVSSVGIALVAVRLFRDCSNVEQKVSVAVLLTVLLAPHLLAYDWTLLLIPGVLLWNLASDRWSSLVPAASAVAIVSALGLLLAGRFLDTRGYAVQLAPIVLIACGWWIRDLLGSSPRRAID